MAHTINNKLYVDLLVTIVGYYFFRFEIIRRENINTVSNGVFFKPTCIRS